MVNIARGGSGRAGWRIGVAGAAAILLGVPGLAGAASTPAASSLTAYQHTVWKAENGVPADIRSMAQTTDGWLWLGTSGGLYRFDGTQFERAPGELGHLRIHELYAGPAGELFAGEYGGTLRVLHPDGRTDILPGSDGPTLGPISAMAQDGDGQLWAIGTAIHCWDGKRWRTVDADPAWQHTDIRSLAIGGDGSVWAAHDRGVKRLVRGGAAFEQVDRQGGGSLGMAPDGTVWLLPKTGTRARRLAAAAPRPGARPARFNPSGSRFAGLFDDAGSLWKLRCPEPLCVNRAPQQGAGFETRAEAWQLSGSDPRQILEDREGNVWIATQRGLDRFRPSRLRPSGLPTDGGAISMAADADGRVWAADATSGTLWQVATDGAARAMPGPPIDIVVPDGRGGVLLGGRRAVWRQAGSRRTVYPLPLGGAGQAAEARVMALFDDGKIVWAAGPGIGLLGWRDGRWHDYREFKLTDKLYILRPGGSGQIWMGRAGGELLHYDNDTLTRHDARAVGFMTGIFPGSPLVVGGDGGLAVLEGGRIRMLRAAHPDVLRGISGMVTTPDGDRWLNGAAGIVHVRAGDWARAMAQPAAELRYELFDTLDGYPGRALIETSQPSAVSGDGRHLWFIGTEGVVGLDTAALYRNGVRPTLAIKGVQTEGGMLAPGSVVRIPAGTGRFAVHFTAPALRMPERIRFDYRLDGFDHAWQEGGARRMAEYTNVAPGAYRFRVRAYNEDGLPGAAEVSQALDIAPTLTQTLWFRVLAGMLLALSAVVLYAYRMRYLTARLTEKLRVKTAERERIARALHDSFLQSVQSLLMQVDMTATRLPEDAPARRELETIRNRAREALVEGRGQLAELRDGDMFELDAWIARVMEDLRATVPGIRFTLHVDGDRRALLADIADDVGNIAREALRNAAMHAGAAAIDVTVAYGKRALALTVADDGCGIDPDVVRAQGKPGHWGLAGMRERASRIGAVLEIDGGPGTSVRLVVPARKAYVSA